MDVSVIHVILPDTQIIPVTPGDKTSILSGGGKAYGPNWSSLRGSAPNHDKF